MRMSCKSMGGVVLDFNFTSPLYVVLKESLFVLQGVAIALKCGATKAQFDATVRLAVHKIYVNFVCLQHLFKPVVATDGYEKGGLF